VSTRIVTPRNALLAFAALCMAGACLTQDLGRGPQHGWWDGLGPVMPHDTFPADCQLCHEGQDWQSLRDDFSFDHYRETGVRLDGAHEEARCLRCHNDRGPAVVFDAQGCAGCHEDIHTGDLGQDCQTCHTQQNWRPFGQVSLHSRTRFPLVGAHAVTSCRRCHPGAEVGHFVPTDNQCLTCHQADFAIAINPNHALLGWTYDCNRCHMPTTWQQAEVDPNFLPVPAAASAGPQGATRGRPDFRRGLFKSGTDRPR
jgi:hypothetical protein